MKKISIFLVLFLTLFIGTITVKANVNTTKRTQDDLGVNKNFSINSNNINNVLNTPRVDASEKIYDFADILDEDTKEDLYKKIENFIETSNMDMVILTTDLPYSDSQLEDYAADFYDYNDFGLDYDKYSGVIIIRNVNSYNKYFNIYTFGDAQIYFPYERCEDILDTIYDDIHLENYLSGFGKFISECERYYKLGIPYSSKNKYVDDKGFVHTKYVIPYMGAVIFSFIITIIIMIILISKNKMVKKAINADVYLDSNSVNYTKMEDRFINTHTTSYTISSSSGSGGGGGSHIGSSGGGHGGGGGRHG